VSIAAGRHLLIAFDPAGFLTQTMLANPSDGPAGGAQLIDVRGYDAGGTLRWDCRAADLSVLPTNLPDALVTVANSAGSARSATFGLLALAGSGPARRIATYPGVASLPVYAGHGLVTYAVSRGGHLRYCVLHAGKRRSITLPGRSDFAIWAVSADGKRIAAVQPSGSKYMLSWVTLDRAGRPRLEHSALIGQAYVALSPDGRTAVLGGPHPRLVRFGAEEGEKLPLSYVSYAQFARNRLLLQETSQSSDVLAGQTMQTRVTSVFVVLTHASPSPPRTISGASMIHEDPSLKFLSWVDDASGTAHVMRLGDGTTATLPGHFDDIGFATWAKLVAVDRAGGVIRLANPLARG
jgi:hypothetical protein